MITEDSLSGQTALVTGASGGIGNALAHRLVDAGVDLVLTYASHAADVETLVEHAHRQGRQASTLHADFTEPDAPQRVADTAQNRLRRVDLLLPAAGTGTETAWQQVTPEQWDSAFTVNARAPFLLAQQLLPSMCQRGFGRVLLFSSIAALNGGVIGPHYAASKAALHGLVHYLAARVADTGVTVNALAPALVAGTRMLPADPDATPPLPIPVGRYGTVDEVAEMAMAVLRTGYLTSKVLPVDGGLHPQ